MQREAQPVVFVVSGTEYEFDPATGDHNYTGDNPTLTRLLNRIGRGDFHIDGPNQDGLEHLAAEVWGDPTSRDRRERLTASLRYYDGVDLIHDRE